MKRRNFIKVSGAVGGGFLLSMSFPWSNDLFAKETAPQFQPSAFLKIDGQGNITFTLTKLEMGQGSGTGLPMIIADELGAAWDKLKVERAGYDKRFSRNEQGTTGGSSSIRKLWRPLRDAGAAARMMFITAAAQQMKAKTNKDYSEKDFYTQNNQVIHRPSGKKMDFGQLAGKAAKIPVPKKLTYKDTKEYQYIGKPVKNLITPNLVVGKDEYTSNFTLPNMLYAAALRCPVYQGKLKSYDDSAALKVKGVKQVVKITNVDLKNDPYVYDSVVVVADSTWAAFKGKQALKVQWEYGPNGKRNMDSVRKEVLAAAKKPLKPSVNLGNVSDAFAKADEVLEATYENPFQAHALMEPISAVARFKGTQCEVWTATQSVQYATKIAAQVLNTSEDKVKVNVLPSGGSFGRRGEDFVAEAVLISKAIGGKPVKLVWSREDELQHDQYHPYFYNTIRAAIKDKKIVGWENNIVRVAGGKGGDALYDIFYEFPHIKTQCAVVKPPFPMGAWRSVVVHSASLSLESFIDETAHKLGKDPYKFRMEHLEAPVSLVGTGDRANLIKNYRQLTRTRYKAVLQEVTQKAQWGKKMPKGHGQGLAVTGFSRTACAQVAEVSVVNGALKVHKITCAMHLGRVINPHFVRGQAEGGIIWALSALLYGGVDFEKGQVKNSNYHNNKILRLSEMPEIEVHLIESDEDPTGAGEPSVPPLAPAVLNAIFAATGKRIRKIPVLNRDLNSR
ncbi:MAG TPA: hypothetical protein DCS93_01420 [Microscillaceae bacterium]|nr:hypothetical protein [Microscillaceae bacterium]